MMNDKPLFTVIAGHFDDHFGDVREVEKHFNDYDAANTLVARLECSERFDYVDFITND